MKQHLKTSLEHGEKVIDGDSGEILFEESKKFQYIAGDPGDFVFVYTSLLNIISRWKLSQAGICAYAYFLENYSTGTIFSISKAVRDELARRSGKNETTFFNVTRELLGLKLIVQVGYRSYRLNPGYAFKGSRGDQKKAMFEVLQICPDCNKKD